MANYCEGCGEDPVTHETIIDQVTGKAIDHHFCANCPKAKGLIGPPAGTEVDLKSPSGWLVAGSKYGLPNSRRHEPD